MEHEIDGWIEQLSNCKQLTEADVKRLCDKVRSALADGDKTKCHCIRAIVPCTLYVLDALG